VRARHREGRASTIRSHLPPAPWRDRIALWQLFPLLVHAVLFGGGYLHQSHDLARRLAGA
jgi:fructosamine-3-kinase